MPSASVVSLFVLDLAFALLLSCFSAFRGRVKLHDEQESPNEGARLR